MVITQEAKMLLNELFEKNSSDCLKVSLQKSCCGETIVISLAKLSDDDKPIDVNGVSVLMNEKVQKRAMTVTLTSKNGKLVVQDKMDSCCC